MRSLSGGLAALLLIAESAAAQQNPITSASRLWLEWNVTPNVQWAPGSVDPQADPDRTLNVLKLQPVFPIRLNEDWTVLTRTIFRFVSVPFASPELRLTPIVEPLVLGWNQCNRSGLSDVSPTAFLCPTSALNGPLLSGHRW